MPRVETLLCSEFFSDRILTTTEDIDISTWTSIQLPFTYPSIVMTDRIEAIHSDQYGAEPDQMNPSTLCGEMGEEGDAITWTGMEKCDQPRPISSRHESDLQACPRMRGFIETKPGGKD